MQPKSDGFKLFPNTGSSVIGANGWWAAASLIQGILISAGLFLLPLVGLDPDTTCVPAQDVFGRCEQQAPLMAWWQGPKEKAVWLQQIFFLRFLKYCWPHQLFWLLVPLISPWITLNSEGFGREWIMKVSSLRLSFLAKAHTKGTEKKICELHGEDAVSLLGNRHPPYSHLILHVLVVCLDSRLVTFLWRNSS